MVAITNPNFTKLIEMTRALEISETNIIENENGFVILGKSNKQIKTIDVDEDGAYLFLVITDSPRKFSAVVTKLIKCGIKAAWQNYEHKQGYFTSGTLPDVKDAPMLRKLLGIRRSRKLDIPSQKAYS